MFENDSVVSSISECDVLAWLWIWSVMWRRLEDLAEREARSVLFCLLFVRWVLWLEIRRDLLFARVGVGHVGLLSGLFCIE